MSGASVFCIGHSNQTITLGQAMQEYVSRRVEIDLEKIAGHITFLRVLPPPSSPSPPMQNFYR